jgi:hypothetical protein
VRIIDLERCGVIHQSSSTALAVDGGGWHLVGECPRQPGRARDVETLLADLRDATTDDLADGARIDVGALQHGLHVTEEMRGVGAGEAAVAPGDRRAHGVDENGLPHGCLAALVERNERCIIPIRTLPASRASMPL